MTTIEVGKGEECLLPIPAPRRSILKKRSQDDTARGGSVDGGLRPQQERDPCITVAETDVANSNPQGVRPQRDPEPTRKGVEGGASHGPRVVAGAEGTSSEDGELDSACICFSKYGGLDISLSAVQEENVLEGKRVVVKGTVESKGCAYKVVCQIRKIEDPRQRRRSTNDPGKKSKVQPGARDVHEGDRTQPLQPKGPGSSQSRRKRTDNSKGKKPVSTSPRLTHAVESMSESCSSKSGSVKMGYARRNAHDRRHASNVQVNDRKSILSDASRVSDGECGHNTKSRPLQNGWRRHEWRYDNRTRELRCSDCDNSEFTPGVVRSCHEKRRANAKKLGRKLGVTIFVVKYKAESNRESTLDLENEGAFLTVRRRGRSRRNNGKRARTVDEADLTTMVGSHGTRAQGRVGSAAVSSDIVLPTQTSSGTRRMGNDARSNKSTGNVNGRVRTVQGKAVPVSKDSMDSTLPTPLGSTDSRPSLPATEKSVMVEKWIDSASKSSTAEGDRYASSTDDELRAATNGKGAQTYARATSNGVGAVGDNTNRADKVGRFHNRIATASEVVNRVVALQDKGRTLYPDCLKYKSGCLLRDATEREIAHCVAADFKLGAGIAKSIKETYGAPKCRAPVGYAAVQSTEDGRILHLVTKAVSSIPAVKQRNAYTKFTAALLHACELSISKEIGVPNGIGCGLDKLDANIVRNILAEVGHMRGKVFVIYNNA